MNEINILVCDPVSPKGIALLEKQPGFKVTVLKQRLAEPELLPLVADKTALIVRSETKITKAVIDAARQLKVVGRAGVGVDNVDVEYATQRGVVVMNTPGGNTISTAELTFSMLLSLARNIPQAHASMKAGEWNRKAFAGIEVFGKTLGVLGLGRIGSEVAKRAQAFGMKVLGYDPYISLTRAKSLQIEMADLDEIYARADFITVHMPLTDETRGMINAETISKMKTGVRIINCARGGIVVENDLCEAIKSGKVAGAALDVYEVEPLPKDSPLRQLPQVIMTPHLGASTEEAQDNVGIEIAEAIIDFLVNGTIRNAVNMPSLDEKTYAIVKPFLNLGEKLGKLVGQIAPRRNEKIVITYGGRAVDLPTEPITRCLLKGFLEHIVGQDVNQVNVRVLANSLGIKIQEVRSSEETDYFEWIHISVKSNGEEYSAAGTILGKNQQPRIVELYERPIEVVPEGVLLLFFNKDRPGIVGYIGSILSKYNINIASMSLNRDIVGGKALTVINLDNVPDSRVIDEIKKDPDITNVKVVKL
ncbi:MAG: phosphoglycerate dehydrogenase [Verrucomicrobiia bacterium]|jgi:D-3-phosphoglycerate dehydrogenase